MTYEPAIWEGDPPRSDEAAEEELERRMDAMERVPGSPAGTGSVAPRIRAFVDAALARFPEREAPAGAPRGSGNSDGWPRTGWFGRLLGRG